MNAEIVENPDVNSVMDANFKKLNKERSSLLQEYRQVISDLTPALEAPVPNLAMLSPKPP